MTETQHAIGAVLTEPPSWVTDTYAAVDALDVEGFVAHLTDDVRFRFGTAEATVGKQPVRDGLTYFFGAIGGMKHHFHEVWETDDDRSVLVIDVDYTRHDGQVVTVPAVTLVHRAGELVDDMQIVIDLAPVMA